MSDTYFLDLLISLVVTVAIYSLPIIIVRYAILRRPIARTTAMWVTIIYAIFAFFAMSFLISYLSDGKEINKSGTVIILWSYINFKMLTGGKNTRKPKKQKIEATNNNAVDAEPTPIAKPLKIKYCKECGSKIDGKTKKCTGCGKQYFHLPKVTVLRIIMIVIVLGLVGLNVYQYIERNQTVTELNEKLSRMIEYKDDLNDRCNDYSSQLSSLQNKLNFWNNNAVICTTAGKKYHNYGCGHLEGRSFYIFNTEYAEYLGYTPCLDCMTEWDKMTYNGGN